MNLLLLSNSTGPGGYLTDHLAAIADLCADTCGTGPAVFVPYAGVVRDWDDYTHAVSSALRPTGLDILPLHRADDATVALKNASLVIVGGGNTFHLLHHCRRAGVLDAIRRRVQEGAPYLGWSAGANLACPSICTTNDMPVIDPGGFDALGLVPWQINPHYTNALPEGIKGESRNQRLAEFTRLRPDVPVIGLPEGNWLRIRPDAPPTLGGPHPSWWFEGEHAPRQMASGPFRAFWASKAGENVNRP